MHLIIGSMNENIRIVMSMNKAKNVERMTAYVKKVNVMVEKNKQ